MYFRYMEVCTSNQFINGAYSGNPSHFTQVVWNASRLFGISKADFKSKGQHCTIAVALYSEPGNFISKMKANVKQGTFSFNQCGFPDLILVVAEEKVKKLEAAAILAKLLTTARPPTTAASPGSADESETPSTTPAGDLKASPTPFTQFTAPASAEEDGMTAASVLTTEIPKTTKASGDGSNKLKTTKPPSSSGSNGKGLG